MTPADLTTVGLHPSVDTVSWVVFNAEFERTYRRVREKAFQELFRLIMRRAHRDEFAEVRPHGALGDYSCDGYLRTTRTVFACYAPKTMRAYEKRVLTKVKQDHAGAIEHWKPLMSEWRLVHNDDEGLPPHLVQLIEELRPVAPDLNIGDWNIEDVRSIVQRLTRDDLVALFGPQLSLRDVIGLSHDDVKGVVDDLAAIIEHVEVAAESDVRAVPPAKLEFNKLARATRAFISLGEQKSVVVQQYFDRQTDPLLAGKLAERFRQKYLELREQSLAPDDIFQALQIFSGYYRNTTRQMAALALLAYLFETCHIFERPPDLTESKA